MIPPHHSLIGPILSLARKPASCFHDKACMFYGSENLTEIFESHCIIKDRHTWSHAAPTTSLFSSVLFVNCSLPRLPNSYSTRMTRSCFPNAIMNQSVSHRTVHRNALPGWKANLVSWMVSEIQIASGCRMRWLYSWPRKTQRHTKTPLGDKLLEIRRPAFLGPDSTTILPP